MAKPFLQIHQRNKAKASSMLLLLNIFCVLVGVKGNGFFQTSKRAFLFTEGRAYSDNSSQRCVSNVSNAVKLIKEMMDELSTIECLVVPDNSGVAHQSLFLNYWLAEKRLGERNGRECELGRPVEYEGLAQEVEAWASELLFQQDGEVDGWNEVPCNCLLRSSFNANGNTKTFMKWMKDSRGSLADAGDSREYPCIKVYATIDAPLEEVCTYLSEEANLHKYNDLVTNHHDLEELSPSSKICLSQTRKVLCIQPRNLVTFCHHRWRSDGTQVVVNQAMDEYGGIKASAAAFRGATFIGRDPNDPSKTRICMIVHSCPGSDIPAWVCKAAINAVAPVEPFKLIHRINKGVHNAKEFLNLKSKDVFLSNGRSSRPAGLCQLGLSCFWPNGGGVIEA